MKTPDQATHGRPSSPSASISSRGEDKNTTATAPAHLERRRASDQPTGERIRRAQNLALRANSKPVALPMVPWAEPIGEDVEDDGFITVHPKLGERA